MESHNNKKICISSGDGVLLCKGSSLKFIFAKPDSKERMENFNFFANDMIGKPFGTAYKVNGKQLTQINPREVANYDDDDVDQQEKDNRAIIDDSSAQKMSRDEIMKLKEAGKDGEEIIERIMDNSKTFNDKNAYSKAKYLKKKKKKHLAHFITCQPSARLLCQLFFQKASAKILEMRPDTLAQMLTWSNVHSGSKVLLVETCQGLVLGSILERLGREGQIVQGYPGDFPVRIILNKFNFSQKIKSDMICGFSLERLETLKNSFQKSEANDEELMAVSNDEASNISIAKCENSVLIDQKENAEDKEMDTEEISEEKDSKDSTSMKNTNEISCSAMYTKENQKMEEEQAAVYLKEKKLDSLIIASKYDPMDLMTELIDFIKPSSPIIIYCQFREPLMECYEYLRGRSLALNVVITETWFRDIQVLPNRTHPAITMSGRSGYLLRGIKVDSDAEKTDGNDNEPLAKKLKHE